MAALVDNSGKASSNSGDQTVLESGSYTIAGDNRVLYVAVCSGANTPTNPTGVKWGGSGGTALTQLGSTIDVGSNWKISLWRLIAPTATSSTVYATWGASNDERWMFFISVKDADQTTPNGTVATNTGTDQTPDCNVSGTSGDLLIDFAMVGDQTSSWSTAHTKLQELTGSTNWINGACGNATATGASTALSWTLGYAGSSWSIFGLAINEAAAGVTVTPSVGTLRTVGQAPTVSRTTVGEALPDTGTLRFVGGTPTLRLAVPEVTSPRVTGNNTASGSWAVGYPAHSAGDLVLIGLASDANVTHGTLPGGPNSETAVVLEQHAGDTGTATVRASLWYWIATDAEAAGTVTVTPSASEQWSASAVVIPAGQFDPANPVQDGGTGVGTTGANTCPPFTATYAGGRVGYFAACDADTITGTESGWQLVANQDIGAVTGSFVVRDAETTASESVSGGAVTGVDDGRVSIGFVINPPLNATASPSVGTVRFVGQTPSVSFPDPQTASPTVGTLVFVGQTPTIGVTQAIAPSVGTLRFVGQTPTVAYIANVSVSPSVGTLRFVGQQLPLFDTSALVDFDTPAKSLLIGADQQTFRVLVRKTVGTNPTVDIDLYEGGAWVADLVSGTAVTSTTGQIVSATWNASLLADISGAGVQAFIYGHSSADAQVEIGAVEWVAELEAVQTPTVGTLRFAGAAPSVAYTDHVTVTPTAGTYRFDGQQPSVTSSAAQSVAPSVGTVLVVGQQPTVSYTDHQSVAPTVGTVQFAGQQPTISSSAAVTVAPSVGTVRFDGQQPSSAVTDHVWITPTAGEVRFGGYAPVLSATAHQWTVPSSGELRFVGQQPTLIEGGDKTTAPQSGVIRFVGNAPIASLPRERVGGDDLPPGWSKRRARLKLNRELEYTEQIREIYRQLTGSPQAAEAEAILAPVVPPVAATGESEDARFAAIEARAEALRVRADRLDYDAVQAEIALRLLHRELRDWQEADDLQAIRPLLAQVL